MHLDPVEIQFDGKRPWRTLINLYWPERRAVSLAMLSYLFKASPLWILPVVSANISQRVAIARALLRDPRVLILDEATSSLDTASEAAVQEALERLIVGRTTFIIAHRHAVLRRAHRFLSLDKGTLVESLAAAVVTRRILVEVGAG